MSRERRVMSSPRLIIMYTQRHNSDSAGDGGSDGALEAISKSW